MALIFCIFTHLWKVSKDIGINKVKICLLNKESVSGYGYERTNIAHKCKIFEAVNITFHGYYTHVYTVSKVIGMNTEKICLPNKQYIHVK